MKHITKTEYKQLLENGKTENRGKDHMPVVKLYMPGTGASLVLTELRSEKPLVAWGLGDLSPECCKLTHIDLDRIAEIAAGNGTEIKRAENFSPKSPISVYEAAAKRRRTVELMEDALNRPFVPAAG